MKIRRNRREFGLLLRRSREAIGITQLEIAARMGCHPQFVSNMERGICLPPLKDLKKYLTVYQIDPKIALGQLLKAEEAFLLKVLGVNATNESQKAVDK